MIRSRPGMTPATPPLFRHGAQDIRPAPGLFDVHVNLGMTDSPGIGYGRLAAGEYAALMDTAGITRACVFVPLMQDYAPANRALRDWALAHEPRMQVFARLGGQNGPRPIRRPWQARQALRARLLQGAPQACDLAGFSGVKLIPHLSGLPDEAVFSEINARNLPVLVHAGKTSPPRWIENVLMPRLTTPIILAHLGAYPTEAGLLNDAVDLARRFQRVYLDTSGVWVSEFIRYAARHVPAQILFGSDAPLAHPGVAWLAVASAIRDDAVLEAVGWYNAERLFARLKGPAS